MIVNNFYSATTKFVFNLVSPKYTFEYNCFFSQNFVNFDMSVLLKASDEVYDFFSKTAANIILYFDDEEREQELTNLREIVKQHCIVNAKLKKAYEITERLSALHGTDNGEENEQEVLEEYKEQMSKIDPRVSRDKNLLEYDRQVQALRQDINKESNNEQNDMDEELEVTESIVNVIDPITKKRMTDPVKNTVCGHVYDRESVTAMLKVNKNTRCPVAGCKSKQYIILENLQTDVVLRTYLKKFPV